MFHLKREENISRGQTHECGVRVYVFVVRKSSLSLLKTPLHFRNSWLLLLPRLPFIKQQETSAKGTSYAHSLRIARRLHCTTTVFRAPEHARDQKSYEKLEARPSEPFGTIKYLH